MKKLTIGDLVIKNIRELETKHIEELEKRKKDGKFFFEKHKVFLYKEDFEKFANGFEDAVGYIKKNLPELASIEKSEVTTTENETPVSGDEFINVEFEDLGDK